MTSGGEIEMGKHFLLCDTPQEETETIQYKMGNRQLVGILYSVFRMLDKISWLVKSQKILFFSLRSPHSIQIYLKK